MKFSLRKKIVILEIIFALLLSSVAAIISKRIIEKIVDTHYQERADELSATIARTIDPETAKALTAQVLDIYHSIDDKVGSEDWGSPEFEEYVAKFSAVSESTEFRQLLAHLRSLQEVNTVDCLYLAAIDKNDETMIYLVDAALEDACDPGVFDPIYEVNRAVLTDPTVGFPAYITNTEEYGWLVTAAAPIYDQNDQVICYALTDISMDMIKAQERTFMRLLIGGLAGMTIISCLLAIYFVDKTVVRPINDLSDAASHFNGHNESETKIFEKVNIDTGDEIESLHDSMVQMENKIDDYIDNLVKTKSELHDSRAEADRMNELAHKDALTGIRNKMAYDQEIAKLNEEIREGKKEFGIAMIDLNDLKTINDSYGHECGNIALKIMSDIICNTFLHSPVFRIGGDEFAVVLRNNDYDKIDDLCTEFHTRIKEQNEREDIEPWEKVSAAIGYAKYDENLDKDADSVFRRADQIMYQAKKKMKE